MDKNKQIIYMQTRIIRLASKEWNMSIQAAALIFIEFKVFRFIRDCFDLFHVEGDHAIFVNIIEYLNNKGVMIDAASN